MPCSSKSGGAIPYSVDEHSWIQMGIHVFGVLAKDYAI